MSLSKQCRHPGCLRRAGENGYCANPNHKAISNRRNDREEAFYHTGAWRTIRKTYIIANPVCEDCLEEGRAAYADVVDHIEEIRDNWDRRLDITNLRSRCHAHHNKKTAKARKDRMIRPNDLHNR